MNIEDIGKMLDELNNASQDISVQIEKLQRLQQTMEAEEVIKVLQLFDFDFDTSDLTLKVKDRKKESDAWKALDKAWKHGYHDSIFLEENVKLRGDDGTYKLVVDKADYREHKDPRESWAESEMKILSSFAKKHSLNIIYKRRDEEIKRHTESLKESRDEMLYFKRAMGE